MQLQIKVERILYPPVSEGLTWFILSTNQGVCKGKIYFRPTENQRLVLEGKWVVYKGEKQFDFKTATADLPIDSKSLLFYAAELTQGIGEKTAEKIWDALGDKWGKIEHGDIKGLSEEKIEALRETIRGLQCEKAKTAVITYVTSIGGTIALAQAAFDKWEDQTSGIIETNCYDLVQLPNFGFVNIDRKIRHHFNISDTDPRRIDACINYCIGQIHNGSTVIQWQALRNELVKNGINVALAVKQIQKMFEVEELVPFHESKSLATKRNYDNEMIIKEYI